MNSPRSATRAPALSREATIVVGTVALAVVMLVAARDWPPLSRVESAPWWVGVGGLLGAVYVLGSVVAAPKLGAATLVAVILAGQAVASLLVDHFGWVGFEENPITPGRLAGVAFVAVGVALVRFT